MATADCTVATQGPVKWSLADSSLPKGSLGVSNTETSIKKVDYCGHHDFAGFRQIQPIQNHILINLESFFGGFFRYGSLIPGWSPNAGLEIHQFGIDAAVTNKSTDKWIRYRQI